MKLSVRELRVIIREVLEKDVEAQIEDLQEEPEFTSVEKFIETKLDDDDYSYSFIELQALARNIDQTTKKNKRLRVGDASMKTVDVVRAQLDGMGFKFIGREKLQKTRGFKSSAHGTSPFAGTSGGSGIGDGGLRIGGGPGAMGGGKRMTTFSKTGK